MAEIYKMMQQGTESTSLGAGALGGGALWAGDLWAEAPGARALLVGGIGLPHADIVAVEVIKEGLLIVGGASNQGVNIAGEATVAGKGTFDEIINRGWDIACGGAAVSLMRSA